MPAAGVTRAFRAMGSDCAITLYPTHLVPGDALAPLLDALAHRVAALEACWTRFDPGSDLSRLNAHAGAGPLPVSADLWLLLTRMVRATRITGGAFDPTVAPSLPALGYTGDYRALPADLVPGSVSPAHGITGLALDPGARTAALTAGTALDAGGIGKGLAGDLIARDALVPGIAGVLVDLGGDLVARGNPGPGADRWAIAVRDERDPDGPALARLDLPAGRPVAVATSSTLARRWGSARTVHHVIDPATGASAVLGLAQATVAPAAGLGWVAEAYATAALLADRNAPAWLAARPVTASVLQHLDGTATGTGVTAWREAAA